MIRLAYLVILLATIACAQDETTPKSTPTETTIPLSKSYCITDSVKKWAAEHPNKDLTADDWTKIRQECAK